MWTTSRLVISSGLTVGLLLMSPLVAGAEDRLPDPVRHLFESRCLSCHNDSDHKGDFSLQTRLSAFADGYVVPGNPTDSQLLSVLVADEDAKPSMPREGEPLTSSEVKLVADWIKTGAAWPDRLVLAEPVVDDFDWWSFQPIVRPPIPEFAAASAGKAWIRSPVDAFVLKRQLQQGLTHAAESDRRNLIRRLSYDLIGLPPTPEEIAAFVADDAPDAYEQLVERLLASPQYGERWARHWLDVVEYADTCGYDKDKLRPNAWPYRDYVIRSFNEDKPFSRFVQEQIAGDALFPGEADGILGLGFIAAGPWDFIGHVEVPESKLDGMVARNLDRDDMVSNTLNTFCSITIQCARCHNHKFDPFTQEHYYSLQSVFAAVDRADRVYDADPAVEKQRQQLSTKSEQLVAELKQFDDDVKRQGGEELARLESVITELKPKLAPSAKRPEFGYHSQISPTQTSVKWVEVDLGRDVQISEIVLHPCHDDFAGIGAGFGFPVRFQVEVRPANAEDRSHSWADFTKADFANPGLTAVSLPNSGSTARFVRVTASRLVERQNDYIFALAELEIIDSSGKNVAAGAAVTALDSIEAPVRWRKSNLTDGIRARPVDEAAAAQLATAEAQRAEILKSILTEDKTAEREQLQEQHRKISEQLAAMPQGRMVYAAATHFAPQGNFKATQGVARTVKVLHRGNIQQPKADASPGTVPLSATTAWKFELPDGAGEADRRAALARWISSPENPLTWRSIANRVWQYHFGKGLVESPNDFGRMGQRPTHPELLEWLADEFRTTQSFRHLHRLIVNSATWRQQSTFHEANAGIDSDNQFLWRMNRRRLSAEEVRDTVLSVSGKLNLKMGGPGFYLFALEQTAHSPHYEYHKFDPNDETSHRRSIYRFIVRSQPNPFMTTLDCADSSQSTPRRTETLTSLQALSLLNNKFTLTMARHFSDRVEAESADDSAAGRAFLLTTGREPTADELRVLETYAFEHGLTNLCRVLLNASEFVFID